MSHFPNCKTKIILHNLKGEHWTVNSVPTTRVHTSHTLCGGWMAFVRGNSIKVGDVCIFELIRECELRVRIAEVGKDGLDCQVGKLACSMLSARHDVASHNTSRFMPKKPKVSSKCRMKVDLSDKRLSKIGQEAVLSIEFKKSGRAATTSKKMGLSPKSKAAHKKTGKVFPSICPLDGKLYCNVDLYHKFLQQVSIKYFIFNSKKELYNSIFLTIAMVLLIVKERTKRINVEYFPSVKVSTFQIMTSVSFEL